ncbi:cold shock domain-containing protein [Lentzea sp. E54]|uniref:cold shock domain-containing protein n=1 Tax=Lentzea xerophila TaxID=3435883 RepID=UPI003DA40D76
MTGAGFARGRVLRWHRELGWGVIESSEFDGPIWVHFSSVAPPDRSASPGGYRSLDVNEDVELTAEPADQDGFRWRATLVRRS